MPVPVMESPTLIADVVYEPEVVRVVLVAVVVVREMAASSLLEENGIIPLVTEAALQVPYWTWAPPTDFNPRIT